MNNSRLSKRAITIMLVQWNELYFNESMCVCTFSESSLLVLLLPIFLTKPACGLPNES